MVKTLIISLFLTFTVYCQYIPVLKEYVTDNASLFEISEKNKIDSLCKSIFEEGIAQIVILTENDIPQKAKKYDNLLQYATEIANINRVGRKNIDDGILIYISKNDRKISIANGYLMGEMIPDSTTSRIIRKTITPQFKLKGYGIGIINGIEALKKEIITRRKYMYPEKYK